MEAGYLDRVVPDGEADGAARARAAELADTLHGGSHARTKRALRARVIERLRAAVEGFTGL